MRLVVDKAVALDVLGRHDEAQALYRRALSFEPRSAALLARIAQVERKELRDGGAAIATYRSVLEIDAADAEAQAAQAIANVAEALERLGAGLADVVRTRMFVTDISRWEEYGRAHGAAFGAHRPRRSQG